MMCWGLVEDIRTFCLGQIHPTYSEKLSWKFAWNVKMIIDAVDPHRRPGKFQRKKLKCLSGVNRCRTKSPAISSDLSGVANDGQDLQHFTT